MNQRFARVAPAALFLAMVACSSNGSSSPSTPSTPASMPTSTETDDQFKSDVTTSMQKTFLVELQTLNQAAIDIQTAAPTPMGRGWDPVQDAQAITTMKAAWRRARIAYEHIEGAVAPLFPDVDAAIDARYDDFLAQLASVGGDQNLFDAQGVTGMHAVERILYVDTTPANVVEFEKVLPGYKAAARPATEQEAADFKNKLCARLVTDTKTLVDQWTPAKIDIATAYAGLVALMTEQREKVNKAATGEEESRYSQLTLADIHGNLDGTRTAYAIFEPWILARGGMMQDTAIKAGFDALQVAYDANMGDAIPQPPPTWSAEQPSAADLMSPFGKLYTSVRTAADPNVPTSVVSEMNSAADLLGFKRFKNTP
jgi:iron uptake system component EfeO